MRQDTLAGTGARKLGFVARACPPELTVVLVTPTPTPTATPEAAEVEPLTPLELANGRIDGLLRYIASLESSVKALERALAAGHERVPESPIVATPTPLPTPDRHARTDAGLHADGVGPRGRRTRTAASTACSRRTAAPTARPCLAEVTS